MKKIIQIESAINGYQYLCSMPDINFGVYLSPKAYAICFCKRVNEMFAARELRIDDPDIFTKLTEITVFYEGKN